MKPKYDWQQFLWKSLSYILVAAAASALTLVLWGRGSSKLTELEKIIDRMFIGEYDEAKIQDAAADAMVNALSDRWSYYLSAEEYAAHKESVSNAYVGIGITVVLREDGAGHDIREVAPGSSAQESGVLPGDILIEVQKQSVAELTTAEVRALIGNEAGKPVSIAVLRDGQRQEFTLECRQIQKTVVEGQLLEDNIGYVRIANFNANCGKDTIAVIEQLRQQGAAALLFDVRNNPGGYVNEMIQVLDYLLPEGVLFREVDYRGNETKRTSDADCVKLPIAVLVNADSYSAAEFFAACLREYQWATVVGEQTCGKGYYQNTLALSDGSAVNLSTGKYFTPNGVSLTETGGLTPDVPLSVDEQTAALIYAQAIKPEQDPQLQAAIAAIQTDRE